MICFHSVGDALRLSIDPSSVFEMRTVGVVQGSTHAEWEMRALVEAEAADADVVVPRRLVVEVRRIDAQRIVAAVRRVPSEKPEALNSEVDGSSKTRAGEMIFFDLRLGRASAARELGHVKDRSFYSMMSIFASAPWTGAKKMRLETVTFLMMRWQLAVQAVMWKRSSGK